jgi:hypothetical protein
VQRNGGNSDHEQVVKRHHSFVSPLRKPPTYLMVFSSVALQFSQEVSDPPFVAVRFMHDKTQLGDFRMSAVALKFESTPLQLAARCNMKFEMKDYNLYTISTATFSAYLKCN